MSLALMLPRGCNVKLNVLTRFPRTGTGTSAWVFRAEAGSTSTPNTAPLGAACCGQRVQYETQHSIGFRSSSGRRRWRGGITGAWEWEMTSTKGRRATITWSKMTSWRIKSGRELWRFRNDDLFGGITLQSPRQNRGQGDSGYAQLPWIDNSWSIATRTYMYAYRQCPRPLALWD